MGAFEHEGFSNYDHNQSGRIGKSDGMEKITITEIILDSTVPGGVKYGPEIDGTKGANIRTIRYQKKHESRSMPEEEERVRLEVQLARKDDCPIKAGWQAIFARRADSKWVTHTRLKGPFKKGTNTPQKLEDPVNDFREILARIEELPYDLWETGNYITAGILIPPKLLGDDERNYARGPWFHSACEDFDLCFNTLFDSEGAKELMRMTDEVTLRIGYPKDSEKYKKLHDETIREGNFLLYLSIKQALAGVDRKESAGDSVMKQAEYLYKKHFVNWNHKVIDRPEKPTELRDQ